MHALIAASKEPLTQLPPGFTLLQVIPELETGGAEQTTIDIARAVITQGGRALVACRGGRMAEQITTAGGQIVPMSVHSKNPLTMLANITALKRLMIDERVDLVHVRSRAPAYSALAAARAANVPIVATYHGIYQARSLLKRWYNGIMTRGDAIIANSNFTRDHIISSYNIDSTDITTIYRGVDLNRFDPHAVADERIERLRAEWRIGPDDGRRRVLLAGRLTRWKGQSLVIDAMSRLPMDRLRTVQLLLAGDDQGRTGYRAELQSQIDALGLADRVQIVGHCVDMPAAYLLSDLAVAPSLEPEAFGRTAVEPQVMGRPVLAAAHGATIETVEQGVTGWLVAPGDADAWAAALSEALTLPAEALSAMGQRGRQRARQLFGLDVMCNSTLNLYGRVLEARRR